MIASVTVTSLSRAGAALQDVGERAPSASWACLATTDGRTRLFPSPPWVDGCPPQVVVLALPRPVFRPFAVPQPPINLAASVLGTTVMLTWSLAPVGDSPTSFMVEAGSSSGAADLAQADTGSPESALTATNVSPGRYFVRVRARSPSGTSGPSNEIVVTVAGVCVQPPGAPAALNVNVNGANVTLAWQAPAGQCQPASYAIEAGSAPGLSNLASFSTGSSATTFSASGVGNGTYFVRVRASNAGGMSAASNEVQLTVGALPCLAPPPAPISLIGSPSGTIVALSWGGSTVSVSYIVEVGLTPGTAGVAVRDTGTANTSLQITLPSGTYYIRVRARNACGTSAPSNEAVVVVGSVPPVTTRATVDRPDDTADYQIKAMYVLPSDGVDRQLDTSGAIARSVEGWERWLAGQSGGQRLRLDTYQGALDIGFFRLARTNAQMIAVGAFVRDRIQDEMNAAGFNHPRKIYAVYYDGGSSYSCGGGAWPPALVGNAAAMYLQGTPPGASPCNTNILGTSVDAPGYLDFGMLHEIFHTLGIVATCAPHQWRAGHVSDNANDLMWAGDAFWQLPPRLDLGRDDYFQHGQPCLDASNSVFISPSPPNANRPPGWSPAGAQITVRKGTESQEEEMCVLAPGPRVIRVRRPSQN